MSVYAINKLLYLTENDKSFRQRIKSDPEEVLAELSLTSEEKKALTSGDVLRLFEMGVHAFLLNNLGRHELFGVNSRNYFPRIRGEATP